MNWLTQAGSLCKNQRPNRSISRAPHEVKQIRHVVKRHLGQRIYLAATSTSSPNRKLLQFCHGRPVIQES